MRPRQIFILLLGGCLALWLAGCGGSGTAPEVPGGNEAAGLRGRVVDASDPSRPIAGAIVEVLGTGQAVVTAEDGSYQLTGLPEGPISLVVKLPEGSSPYEGVRLDLTIPEGQVVEMDITLLPSALSREPASIELRPASATVGVQESIRFRALVRNAAGRLLHVHPTWTVTGPEGEPPVGVVSREGIFIGTHVGTGQVVATLNDTLSASAQVTVVPDEEVAHLRVFPRRLELRGGEERLLVAVAINGAGQMMPEAEITWTVEPAELGTLTPVEVPLERLRDLWRVLREEWAGWMKEPPGERPDDGEGDWGFHGWGPSPAGDAEGPRPRTRHVEFVPEAIRVQKFTASAAGGEGLIRVAAGGQQVEVPVEVLARGTLSKVLLQPQEVRVAVGRGVFFHALGLNDRDEPLGGLEFTWSLEKGLGELQELELPVLLPFGPEESGGPGERAEGRLLVAPPEDWPGELPPDWQERFLPDEMPPYWSDFGSARLFRAQQEGEETVLLTVTDPADGTTLEAQAFVHILPRAKLAEVQLRPAAARVPVGGQLLFHALALDTAGEPAMNVEFTWEVRGAIGVLREEQPPIWLAEDGAQAPDWVKPPISLPPEGLSVRLFVAGDTPGEGEIVVTAREREGDAVAKAAAKVRVVERGERPHPFPEGR